MDQKSPSRLAIGHLSSSARMGRIRARLPRYALLALAVVLSTVGVKAIVSPGPSTASPAVARDRSIDYAAESFAAEFARAYLTYDSAHPAVREAAIAAIASPALEPGAGFDPPRAGEQKVEWVDIAQVQHPLAGGVAITVVAKVSRSRSPVYLSVPVARARDGAIYLSGYPSFVGPPLLDRPNTLEKSRDTVEDPEVERLVERALRNYLAGDGENLAADLAPAATVSLPSVRLSLGSADELVWVSGPGSGAVLATVGASGLGGGRYELRYEVGVRRVVAADPRIAPGWRVTYVQAISQES